MLKMCLSLVIKRPKKGYCSVKKQSYRLKYEETALSAKSQLHHVSRLSVALIERKMSSRSQNISARESIKLRKKTDSSHGEVCMKNDHS